jgi:BASS family bile acid:Na+ symporter
MPAGMTSILFTELVGGSVGLALVLTTTTSLLAPITVPLMIKILAGASVTVPTGQMFLTLLNVIIVPFVLAQITRSLFHEKIKMTFWTFKPISILLLGCLIMGVVAREAANITQHVAEFLPALAILCIFFALLHIAGFFGVPHLNRKDRLATTVCLTYMNFTLAIYLAGKFFPDPKVLIPVILSVFPWSIGIIPFKAIISRRSS